MSELAPSSAAPSTAAKTFVWQRVYCNGSMSCLVGLQAHMEPGQTHDFCVTLDGSKAMAERAAELLAGSLPAT